MMHSLEDPADHARTLALARAIHAPAGVVIDESDKLQQIFRSGGEVRAGMAPIRRPIRRGMKRQE